MSRPTIFSDDHQDGAMDGSYRKIIRWLVPSVGVFSLTIYLLTAFRTITWWDNSEYSLAAIVLGIPAPPGTLLPLIIGWLVTKFPIGVTNIFKLNLLAGLAAAITASMICLLAIAISNKSKNIDKPQRNRIQGYSVLLGIGIASLIFAFCQTTWLYAIKFTPYIFTPLMTTVIIWAMIGWRQNSESNDALRWLFLVGLLFGLDFSIHRTNFLLLPGLFFWILLLRSKTLISSKSWLYWATGIFIGLAFHLMIIPIAAKTPIINMGDPSSLSRFWDYISLRQFGGGWLINLWPRKAPFLSVQLKDYLNVFSGNYFSMHGIFGILGLPPLVLGAFGLVALFRSQWRLALAFLILYITASLGAIIYFNLPESYFRSIDRHYMPSLVIFAIFIAYGAGELIKFLSRNGRLVAVLAIISLFAILPGVQLLNNYHGCNGSANFFTIDYAKNVMNTLPQKAIVFTNGDNDTYPLWYLQAAENERPDVTIINIPLLNTLWYVKQLNANNSQTLFGLSDDEIDKLRPCIWHDSIITLPVNCNNSFFSLPENMVLPGSIKLSITPTYSDSILLIQDRLMIKLLTQNAWKRPIYFASTVSSQNLRWLNPFLRLEGVAQRLMPMSAPPINKEILRNNLFIKYKYRGYADVDSQIDEVSRWMAFNMCFAFVQLANAEMQDSDSAACQAILNKMYNLMPPDRLRPLPNELNAAISSLCQNQ